MLPYYSLFDDLEYTVEGRTVILSGSLTSEHADDQVGGRKCGEARRRRGQGH